MVGEKDLVNSVCFSTRRPCVRIMSHEFTCTLICQALRFVCVSVVPARRSTCGSAVVVCQFLVLLRHCGRFGIFASLCSHSVSCWGHFLSLCSQFASFCGLFCVSL